MDKDIQSFRNHLQLDNQTIKKTVEPMWDKVAKAMSLGKEETRKYLINNDQNNVS